MDATFLWKVKGAQQILLLLLVAKACLTLLWPHGRWSARLLCPGDFPDKITGTSTMSPCRGSSPPTIESESPAFSSVQSLSRVRLFATPWTTARQVSLSITNSQSLLKLMPIELVMPSNHLTLCRPLLLLPAVFPRIRVFSNESVPRIRQPKYWSFSFNISPSNEHPGLISFRMDWLALLAVQGTLKSLLQHAGGFSTTEPPGKPQQILEPISFSCLLVLY